MPNNAPPPAPPRRRGENRILIGITGGIGSGKSLASSFFESEGYTVIYADDIAKVLYRTNKRLKGRLVKEFGRAILDSNGNISGLAARKIILSGKRNVQRVNKIVHPFVRKEIIKKLLHIKDKVVFIEAAIMFESGYYKYMDFTVLIYAAKKLRIKRVNKRDKIPMREVNRLIRLQMDEREKLKLADFIIKNNGSKEKFFNSLEVFIGFLHSHLKKNNL